MIKYVVALFCGCLALPSVASISSYSAQQITEINAPKLVMKGDVAWGGVDDWHLSNGVICAIVSDPSHESEISASGGYLTDLGFCGDDSEAFINLYFALNLSSNSKPTIERVEPQAGATGASLITYGSYPGVSFKAEYRLDKANGNRLQMRTELTRTEATEFDLSAINLVQINRGNKIFTGNVDAKGPAPGFKHQALPAGLWDDLDGLVGSDTIISLPDAEAGHALAYGLHVKSAHLLSKDGDQTPLATFVGVTGSYAAIATFSQPFWFDNQGRYLDIVKLVQSQLLDLPLGDSLILEHELTVAKGRSVASVLDGYRSHQAKIEGQLGEANVPVFLHRLDGGLVNQTYSDETGAFSLRAPEGDYQLLIKANGRKPQTKQFRLSAEGYQLASVDMLGAATLLLPKNQVMRLSFAALDGQPLDFSRQPLGFLTGERRDSEVRDIMLIGNSHDQRQVTLAPGRYRVISSRGPEYSAHETTVELVAGKSLQLNIQAPEHSHPQANYVHADLHTHSAPSFDNSYPQSQRVKSYFAQGGEVLVATEHEVIYDIAKDIAQLDLSQQLASVIGTEITGLAATEALPYTLGHANAFPLKVKPYAYRRGQPAHEGKRWREVIAAIKQENANTVVQLNHPRVFYKQGPVPEKNSQSFNESYFFHLLDGEGFDPSKPLTEAPNTSLIEKDEATGFRDVDFDTLELINGTFANLNSYQAIRKDWFALLRQGEKIAGTATSDSHGQSYGEVVLEPRTLIGMPNDNVAEFNSEAFIQSIHDGNLYGTNGPLLAVNLQSQEQSRGMGETWTGKDAVLKVIADGANWVGVNRLRVFVNGELYQELDIKKQQENLIPLSFSKDSFVIIEVEGPREGLFADIVPNMAPFAFSNPIYVDADGDGQWQPPGL